MDVRSRLTSNQKEVRRFRDFRRLRRTSCTLPLARFAVDPGPSSCSRGKAVSPQAGSNESRRTRRRSQRYARGRPSQRALALPATIGPRLDHEPGGLHSANRGHTPDRRKTTENCIVGLLLGAGEKKDFGKSVAEQSALAVDQPKRGIRRCSNMLAGERSQGISRHDLEFRVW